MTDRRLLLRGLLLGLLALPCAAHGERAPPRFDHIFRQEDGLAEHRVLAGESAQILGVVGPDGREAWTVPDPNAPRGYIVQFDAPPVAAARRSGIGLDATRAAYARFLTELPGIEAATRATGAGIAPVSVRRRLEISFNGLAIDASPAVVERIRALPYVSAVFPDDTVRAVLDESLRQIRADSLRARFGVSGDGMVVSIIDTGIEYTHPALGGCFGPACRVIGGYDFYHGDADPIDDNGHGTHVAAIVGGSGAGLDGVAPGVRFLAYKALGPSGGGPVSSVIAAIDRSLDPNGDLDTEDAADVISMSLGGGGDANDAGSQAVDEAVASGTVCIVAAGNAGSYFRMGAPACARRAITVGAVDAQDRMASFSTRGPSLPDHDIKPDVVAPGVNITSAWLLGGTRTASGTSMATPHVAGVVALLLELNPSWAPERVKSALMATGADLGLDSFTQGAGRVDALAAATVDVETRPASLSFGLPPTSVPVWGATKVLTVYNHSNGTQALAFTTRSDLPPGSSCQISPKGLALAPGDSAEVEVSLVLDHAPFVPTPPFAYSGDIVVTGGIQPIRVPFAVLRAASLVVKATAEPINAGGGLVAVHDRSSYWTYFAAGESTPTRLVVPPGTYDVIAILGYGTMVVREGIAVTDSENVAIAYSDAVHEVRCVGISESGTTPYAYTGLTLLRHRANGVGFFSLGGFPDVHHFATMSSDYEWEWHRVSRSEEPVHYHFNGILRGVSGPVVVQNSPSDLRHATVGYHPAPGTSGVHPIHWISNGPRGMPNGITSFGFSSNLLPPLDPPFRQQLYFMSRPEADLQYKSVYIQAYAQGSEPFVPNVPDHLTPYITAEPGQLVRGYVPWDESRPAFSLAQDSLEVGHGPPAWFGRLMNEPDTLLLAPSVAAGSWIFVTQEGGWRGHGTLPFELRREGVPLESGTVPMGSYRPFRQRLVRALTPGGHTLTVTNNSYWIDGAPGVATATLSFNTLNADPNPPFMTGLSILRGDVFSDAIYRGYPNRIRIGVADDAALGPVSLELRPPGETSWQSLALTETGDAFEALLPTELSGVYSLRVKARDATGNEMVYTLEPGVRIHGTTAVHSTAVSVRVVAGRVVLEWLLTKPVEAATGVDRSTDGTSWIPLATLAPDGGTRITYEDASVEAGHRYAYRLRLFADGEETMTEPAWVDVPRIHVLELAPIVPNPVIEGPVLRFGLPNALAARLEIVDLMGRIVYGRDVGTLGAGTHVLDLREARHWAPGVYFVRLRNDDRSFTRKFCVLG